MSFVVFGATLCVRPLIVKSLALAVELVGLPFSVTAAICADFALVTVLLAIVVAQEELVTSPVRTERLEHGSVPVIVEEPRATVNPAPVAPPVSVPTLVRDDARTFAASVPPVSVPAGATTAFPLAAVINPFALTVNVGIEVEVPKLPTLLLTVASVVVRDAPGVETSPVSAGICAAWRVPVTLVVRETVEKLPSARRKLTVPPPEAGTQPSAMLVNVVQLMV